MISRQGVRAVEQINCRQLSLKCVLRLKGRQKLHAVVFFYHFGVFCPESLAEKQGRLFPQDFLAAEPRIVHEERDRFRRGRRFGSFRPRGCIPGAWPQASRTQSLPAQERSFHPLKGKIRAPFRFRGGPADGARPRPFSLSYTARGASRTAPPPCYRKLCICNVL